MNDRVRRVRSVGLRVGWILCAAGVLVPLWGFWTSGVEDVGGLSESEAYAAKSASRLGCWAGLLLFAFGLGALVGAGLGPRARYGVLASVLSAGVLLGVVVTMPWEGFGGAMLAGVSVVLSAMGVTFSVALTSVSVLMHRRNPDGCGRVA